MEPQVLQIEPVTVKAQRKHRMIAVTLQAAFWTLCMSLWTHHFRSHSGGWSASILAWAFGGAVYGLLMYFLPIQKLFGGKSPARASIVVESDQVALSYQGSEGTPWIPQKVVRKGMVRSIFRIMDGIGVSERSQLGARMLGFLVIPKTLPKFNEVRALLESWKADETSVLPPKH